jgi:dnd system-associated protein 4
MRPVYRCKRHRELIETLTSKDFETGAAPFPTIKALQCYAAMLGFESSRREPLNTKDLDNIDWTTFQNDGYAQYIYLIALANSEDVSVLKYDIDKSIPHSPSLDMVEIFEEYSHAGFKILQNWIDKDPSDNCGSNALLNGLKRNGFLDKLEDNIQIDPVRFED